MKAVSYLDNVHEFLQPSRVGEHTRTCGVWESWHPHKQKRLSPTLKGASTDSLKLYLMSAEATRLPITKIKDRMLGKAYDMFFLMLRSSHTGKSPQRSTGFPNNCVVQH